MEENNKNDILEKEAASNKPETKADEASKSGFLGGIFDNVQALIAIAVVLIILAFLIGYGIASALNAGKDADTSGTAATTVSSGETEAASGKDESKESEKTNESEASSEAENASSADASSEADNETETEKTSETDNESDTDETSETEKTTETDNSDNQETTSEDKTDPVSDGKLTVTVGHDNGWGEAPENFVQIDGKIYNGTEKAG